MCVQRDKNSVADGAKGMASDGILWRGLPGSPTGLIICYFSLHPLANLSHKVSSDSDRGEKLHLLMGALQRGVPTGVAGVVMAIFANNRLAHECMWSFCHAVGVWIIRFGGWTGELITQWVQCERFTTVTIKIAILIPAHGAWKPALLGTRQCSRCP